MIDISYTLHTNDGFPISEEVKAPLVPRVGELVTFDQTRSYQVVDVLWHHYGKDSSTAVTVTACELNWHKHDLEVTNEWRRTQKND